MNPNHSLASAVQASVSAQAQVTHSMMRSVWAG